MFDTTRSGPSCAPIAATRRLAWIEAIFDQLNDQLSLERHGTHTMAGLIARVAQRLLAIGAVAQLAPLGGGRARHPVRSLSAYDQ